MKLKLHQFLSKTGTFETKRNVFDAISNGNIKIRNNIITSPNYYIDPKKVKVYYKDKSLKLVKEKLYIILNKPTGYLAGKPNKKEIGKKSALRLVKIDELLKATLFFVGRLDENSTGLIILTNDGEFCSKIIKSQLKRTYKAKLEKELTESDFNKIKEGVIIKLEENGEIKEYKTKSSEIKRLNEKNTYSISLIEGKKREVRRIFESLGNKVISLQRVAIGKLSVSEVRLGKFKIYETREELEKKIGI